MYQYPDENKDENNKIRTKNKTGNKRKTENPQNINRKYTNSDVNVVASVFIPTAQLISLPTQALVHTIIIRRTINIIHNNYCLLVIL